MSTFTRSGDKIQGPSGLPLFDFRVVVVHHKPATRGGLYLTRRYRIHPTIADTIASLAGFDSGDSI